MLIQADARQIPLVDGCVQVVVTSPPYWALRDYGVDDQIGMEKTPLSYIRSLVAVFDDVRRVLADDGVCWVNLGDSYIGSGMTGGTDGKESSEKRRQRMFNGNRRDTVAGYKQKDLAGIPWMFAFAARESGWYLRSDVIWHKPNPMPESVTDRPTKSHEYLFLLTKSERYYYDADAIAEPASLAMREQVEQGYDGLGLKDYATAGVQDPSDVKSRIIANARKRGGLTWDDRKALGEGPRRGYCQNGPGGLASADGLTRNRRSVWTIPTMPYSGAHFATMPEKLVEPCILAGSRFGDVVFDPFSGSGTVLAVAERLGRRAVGTDLNPAYHALAKQRTAQRGIPFSA